MTLEQMQKLQRKDDVMVEWPGEDEHIQAMVLRVFTKQCLVFADVDPGLKVLGPEDVLKSIEPDEPMDTITIQGRNLSVQGGSE